MEREETPELELPEAREAVVAAADELVAACIAARDVEDGERVVLKSLAAVASVTAERAADDDVGLGSALSLCARLIEASAARLDPIRSDPVGLCTVAAAEECAAACRRTLVLLYENV